MCHRTSQPQIKALQGMEVIAKARAMTNPAEAGPRGGADPAVSCVGNP